MPEPRAEIQCRGLRQRYYWHTRSAEPGHLLVTYLLWLVLASAATGLYRESRSLLRSRRIISGEVSRASTAADTSKKNDNGCSTHCLIMYLHVRRLPTSREHAPPHLPGASRLYGEEEKELALAPVGLARHRTKWPCDQLGPPGPPPAHPSCPLGPWGAGWGESSPLIAL